MENYFTDEELLRSATAERHGIANRPDAEAQKNLDALRWGVLNPLRERWGKPIYVTSGYRCARVNRLVGGDPNSQHTKGEAADIGGTSPKENLAMAKVLLSLPNGFDQLILEETGRGDLLPEWLHVSWKRVGSNRRQVLRKVKGEAGYRSVSREEVLR